MAGRPPKRAESEELMAERLTRELRAPAGAITRQSIRTWAAKGYDLHDAESLERSLWAQRTTPKWLVDRAAGDLPAGERPTQSELAYRLNLAKTLKVEAEAELKEIELRRVRENTPTTEEVRQWGRELGAVSRSYWQQVPGWAPFLEGLTAAQMRERMRNEVSRVLGDVHRLMTERGLPVEE